MSTFGLTPATIRDLVDRRRRGLSVDACAAAGNMDTGKVTDWLSRGARDRALGRATLEARLHSAWVDATRDAPLRLPSPPTPATMPMGFVGRRH